MAETLADIARRQQRNDRSASAEPLLETVVGEMLVLAEEICVLRDREDTAQRLIADDKIPTPEAIDAYEPSAEAESERLARHRRFYEALFERLEGSLPTERR